MPSSQVQAGKQAGKQTRMYKTIVITGATNGNNLELALQKKHRYKGKVQQQQKRPRLLQRCNHLQLASKAEGVVIARLCLNSDATYGMSVVSAQVDLLLCTVFAGDERMDTSSTFALCSPCHIMSMPQIESS